MIAIPANGDRIRLLAMSDDPDPIPVGQTGTVVDVSRHGTGRDAWFQIDVDWDCGRSLMLTCPPDTFEVIESRGQKYASPNPV